MPEVSTNVDLCRGHDGCPARAFATFSNDTSIEDEWAVRETDELKSHGCPRHRPHGATVTRGFSTVTVNGHPIAYVGASVSCPSGIVNTGRATVFVGESYAGRVAERGGHLSERAPKKNAPFRGYKTKEEFLQAHGGKFTSETEANAAWDVYHQTNSSHLPVIIGRLERTSKADPTRYEILNSPNWTQTVNNMFIQGGIDQGAVFYLVTSPVGPADIYNPPGSRFVTTVYKGEIDQLLNAGYRFSRDNRYLLPPGMTSPPPGLSE